MGISEGYEIYVAKLISKDIKHQAKSTTTVMTLPCLLTKIFLDARAQELPDVDQFIRSYTTIDLVLIKYDAHPMSKAAK